MKRNKFNEFLKEFTSEEGINEDGLFTAINKHLDGIIINKEETVKASTIKNAREDIINDFLKDNEFNNLDEFNAFRKNGATADSEAVTRLQKELDTYKNKSNEYETEISKLNGTITNYNSDKLLIKDGIEDEDKREFYKFKINKLDGETFEEKYSAFKNDNPDIFKEQPKQKPHISTNKPINRTNQNSDGDYPFEKILKERGLLK